MQTFSVSSAVKITENQLGHTMITKTYPRPQAQTYKVGGKVKDNEYTEEFKKEFKELNIPILPLPENYMSDKFMHMLLRESSTWREDSEISYSTSTDCDPGRLDVVPIEPIKEWFQVFYLRFFCNRSRRSLSQLRFLFFQNW